MDFLLLSLQKAGVCLVVGEGPIDAKFMLVGEALGEQEELQGRPFVGSAGFMLDRCLSAVGINRSNCYITNVVPLRPKDNDLANLKLLGVKIEDFYPSLASRISTINPNCIVALGDTAFKALCDIEGITKWRGSILNSSLVAGKKVIPTFHPSFINRLGDKTAKSEIETFGKGGFSYDYGTARVCLCLDLKRAKEESRNGTFIEEPFGYSVCDTPDTVSGLVSSLLCSPYVAFDIETRGHQNVSIAFSSDGVLGSVVPLDPDWTSEHFSQEFFRLLASLFSEHNGLIAQNGIFDITMLLQHFLVRRLHFDTMVAHHTVYPELPHSLAFLTSVYTKFPYYKWMRTGGSREQFFKYNALDAVATMQVANRLKEELKEFELFDFFYGYVMPLWHTIFKMGMRGIKVDKKAMEEMDQVLENECAGLQKKLEDSIGQELNVRSSKQLKEFFYVKMKLSRQTKRGTGKDTVDEEALEKLAKKSPIAKQVLEIRKKENMRSKFTRAKIDEDERIRTIYSQSVTDTGRLSSKKTLWNSGLNLQNVPREPEKRKMFIADLGKVLVRFDLAQAEARLVAWFSGDKKLKLFLRTGGDIHLWNASLIFNKPIEEITKEERYFAKRIVHAFNYGLGPIHLIDLVFMETGEIWSLTKAKSVRESYFANSPSIRSWHEEIRMVMNTTRTLINPLGRRRTFFGRIGEDLHRKMLAFLPQSSCVDYLNIGLVRIDIQLPDGAEFLLQVHDEGILQCWPGQVQEIVEIIRKELSFPIEIHGDLLTIPVEIKVGPSWGESEIWKDVTI